MKPKMLLQSLLIFPICNQFADILKILATNFRNATRNYNENEKQNA